MQVRVRSADGVINLLVDRLDTVREVKHKVYMRQLCRESAQSLFFGHLLLEDDQTLEDYGIEMNDELTLLLPSGI